MITSVNNLNAGKYKILYAKAMKDLISHTFDSGEGKFVKITENNFTNEGKLNVATAFGEEMIQYYSAAQIDDDDDIYSFFVWDSENKEFIQLEEKPAGDDNRKFLKVPGISSLNTYFANIENLAAIDRRYTVLPILNLENEEETFNIDANTREIKVPEHFKKNGISVEGDEISEIVYFKINRYFDAQDLKDPDMQILIQWKTSATDDLGNAVEGISKAYCVDVETSPNYIIFGWPISSAITAEAGDVSFAVRFYKYNENSTKLDYSLSTLTQKVNIKPSLNLDIAGKISNPIESKLILDDSEQLIIGRLRDSDVNDASIQAGEPYFILNINSKNDSTGNAELLASNLSHLIIPQGENVDNSVIEAFLGESNETPGLYNQPISIYCEANGDGNITYEWSKLRLDSNNQIEIGNNFTPSSSWYYKETEDTQRNNLKTYYYQKDNNVWVKYEGRFESDENYNAEEGDLLNSQIFERYTKVTLDTVGAYQAIITNRVQNSKVKTKTPIILVKRPVQPEVVLNNFENEQYSLALTPQEEGENIKYVGNLSATASNADTSGKGYLTYKWFKKAFDNTISQWGDWEQISNATEANYNIEASNGENLGDFKGYPGDGYYKVIVYNNLNRDYDNETGAAKEEEFYNAFKESPEVLVTRKASKLDITMVDNQGTIYNPNVGFPSGLEMQAVVAFKDEAHELLVGQDGEQLLHEITYQWYKHVESDPTTAMADANNASAGNYIPTEEDSIIEDANSDKFTPQMPGTYFCLITNKYNNDESVTSSRFVTVY